MQPEKIFLMETPPGEDTPEVRAVLIGLAEDRGWSDFEWVETKNTYGQPVARLYGRKPDQEGSP